MASHFLFRPFHRFQHSKIPSGQYHVIAIADRFLCHGLRSYEQSAVFTVVRNSLHIIRVIQEIDDFLVVIVDAAFDNDRKRSRSLRRD